MTIFQSAAQMTGRPYNRIMAALGDSRTDYLTSANGYENLSPLNHLRFLTRQAFDLPIENNFGVGGDTSTMMLARVDAMLAATDAAVIVVWGPTNDRGGANMTYAASVANMEAIRDKIIAAGRICWFIAEAPRGDATFTSNRLSGQQLGNHIRMRQWFLDQRNTPGVYVSDPWPRLADPHSTTGDAIVGKFYDGLHQSVVGAHDIALSMLPVADFLYPRLDLVPVTNSDVYHASQNPNGCLVANPMFSGTAGAPGTGGSGDLADGWLGSNSGGASGATRTYSKYLEDGIEWQQVDIGGTPTGSSPSIELVRQIGITGLNEGDVLRGVADVYIDEGSTGILGIGLRITDQTNNVSWTDMDRYATPSYIPDVAMSGVMQTPDAVVASGSPDIRFQLTAWLDQNVPCAATVWIKSAAVRKVI
jgi:hypothetical protein